MNFSGKKILFFAPNSFGYEYEIKKELERMKAIVTYYDERPSNSTLVKTVIRLNKKSVRAYTDKYFEKIVHKESGNVYDFIFVLRGEAFSPQIMHDLKIAFQSAYFVLYLWDSIKNNNTLDIVPFFDKVYSFDRLDCIKYSSLSFLPLFYLSDYSSLDFKKSNYNSTSLKIMFVGTVHSDRYLFIEGLKKELVSHNIIFDTYYFFQSKLLYWRRKLTDNSFKDTCANDFNYVSLSKEDILQRMEECAAVLDIQHPSQNGLTMRCIETFGAHRKLITTNQDIKEYNFYNDSNMLILDRNASLKESALKILNFINAPFEIVDPLLYEKYSLKSWLMKILEIK